MKQSLKINPMHEAWHALSQHYLLPLFADRGNESACLTGESALLTVSCPFLLWPLSDTCSSPWE